MGAIDGWLNTSFRVAMWAPPFGLPEPAPLQPVFAEPVSDFQNKVAMKNPVLAPLKHPIRFVEAIDGSGLQGCQRELSLVFPIKNELTSNGTIADASTVAVRNNKYTSSSLDGDLIQSHGELGQVHGLELPGRHGAE